jgi:LmbE family N-acetylglucosaminyl deacetylase
MNLNKLSAVVLTLLFILVSAAGAEPLRVILVGAHPDDAEWGGAGTTALWAASGVEVMHVSVTNGDAGHQGEGGGALARRRAAESRNAARILGVQWRTLGFHDGELVPSLEARKAVIRAIREWRADIVISHRPNDYHPDHRYTGMIVQDAAYMVAVPNVCPETPRLEKNPVFMYFADRFKKPNPFSPDVVVDITPVAEKKLRALASMVSQVFEWGPWISGGDPSAVPGEEQARLEWMRPGWLHTRVDKNHPYLKLLAERYGAEHAGRVSYAEAFELCEYGRQPSREELWELFPK